MNRIMLNCAACVLSIGAVGAQAQSDYRAPAYHVRLTPLQEPEFFPDDYGLLVRHETTIDTGGFSYYRPWGAGSYFTFHPDASHVTFHRSLQGLDNAEHLHSYMRYPSYEDLRLGEGDVRKKVIVYENPHFIWMEVSQQEHEMTDVSNALFFVGPSQDEHRGALQAGNPAYLYDDFKREVQKNCADNIRMAPCDNVDTAALMRILSFPLLWAGGEDD